MESNLLPILKWPGSKRWFVKYLNEYLPKDYKTYIEPFFGGGSVFFALEPEKAVLSDINKELITTYRLVRDEWATVKEYLQELEIKHDEKMYYQVRDLEPNVLVNFKSGIDKLDKETYKLIALIAIKC